MRYFDMGSDGPDLIYNLDIYYSSDDFGRAGGNDGTDEVIWLKKKKKKIAERRSFFQLNMDIFPK